MAVVARAAGLADVLALGFGRFANGLAEGDLGLAHIGFDFVLTPHAVDQNLKMQLTHAADDRLTRFIIRANLEGRIFVGQARERNAHLFLIGLGLGLDSYRDDRLRKDDGAQGDRMMRIAQGIASLQFLHAHARADITSKDLGHVFALVGMHLHQSSDALRLAGARIQHRVAGLQRARVDADEAQLAERIVDDLERQRRQRLAVFRFANLILSGMRRIRPLYRGLVQRAG